ncbi:MAG: PDZ domain-containing protein [Nitrospirae bacterium]|nr:MAG: PDZ domain-containing protein [Nitrospirota bacterium]
MVSILKRPSAILILALGLFVFFKGPLWALTDEEKTNIRVYKEVAPSVVNITTTTLIRDFFSVYPSKGAGSGSIIDSRGFILTNYHVVEDAAEITVTLSNGHKYSARLIGADPENDIAIIKIEPSEKLRPLKLGDSSNLQVGQRVYAIGNPFGLNSTLTTGIISALGRPLTTESGRVIENVIQTDAPINPGNSGGPLINTAGEMIGINTAIFTPSGGNIGIGFAIPVDTAKELIPDLIRYGKVRRPWIGIVGIPLWDRLAEALHLPVSEGILVSEVVPKSPAYYAGIRGGSIPVEISSTILYLGGDIILEINHKKVKSMDDIKKALRHVREGQMVDVKLLRKDRVIMTKIKVRLLS